MKYINTSPFKTSRFFRNNKRSNIMYKNGNKNQEGVISSEEIEWVKSKQKEQKYTYEKFDPLLNEWVIDLQKTIKEIQERCVHWEKIPESKYGGYVCRTTTGERYEVFSMWGKRDEYLGKLVREYNNGAREINKLLWDPDTEIAVKIVKTHFYSIAKKQGT